ncbi:uncharacterized protein LOC107642926 isoform X2 [Arachis ipaensis]|uniref:uncharacterized protein LOC107642926 isoform X2 n=1 Tax=Arachis ipaensis TaxID=130454 RepID=UPI0007AFDB1A|nr:uncharacterized protein LOC107642926 isoform X2 [Arachis ipaensis]XP_025653540.1 uncharacterized protein LOC112749496 isoform X2 [Arachis hypogaea]QHO10786.1 uncharacterized protein DS421_15g492620 [Arachis hypogaea]
MSTTSLSFRALIVGVSKSTPSTRFWDRFNIAVHIFIAAIQGVIFQWVPFHFHVGSSHHAGIYVFIPLPGSDVSSCIQSSTQGTSALVPVNPCSPCRTFFTLRWRRSRSWSVG